MLLTAFLLLHCGRISCLCWTYKPQPHRQCLFLAVPIFSATVPSLSVFFQGFQDFNATADDYYRDF